MCVFVIPFCRSAFEFALDLTSEFPASFLAPAIYAFNIALETTPSVKLQGVGHHLRRRADFVASSS